MTRFLVLFYLLLTVNDCCAQIHDINHIVDQSRKFYDGRKNGELVIQTTFKSAIAESYNTEVIKIAFCHDEALINMTAGQYSSLLSTHNYYFVDNAGKKYIDLSDEKEMIAERKAYLNRYPQFNATFFSGFRTKQHKVDTGDGLIHIHDATDHFYFDPADYSLVRHRNIDISQYGIQISEWKIEHQSYPPGCNPGVSSDSFPATFTKVSSFRPIRETPSLAGQNLWDIIGGRVIVTGDGNTFHADSLAGKYILIDFFYQSCMPCIQSFRPLKELYPFVRDSKLVIIGIDPVLNDATTMEKFKTRYKLSHPVMTNADAVRINDIFNPAGVFPSYVLIDPGGRVREIFEGYDEAFFTRVKALLHRFNAGK